ncbi:hypothetical protein [Zunongwangia sp.]|uniref:hypothetical protein n=1 Tax=Zunongwangia sp. TaxID=1965325 RepID=UPI003AA86B79
MFINIVNITQETGRVSKEDGSFKIKASLNDSILFSSVQFQKKKLKISEEILESGYFEVFLEKEITDLEEVYLSNSSLSGNLENDIKNIKVKPLLFSKPYRKKLTMIDRQMLAYRGGLGLLIGSITGDLKMLKKAKANGELKGKAYLFYNALPKDIFTENFGLEEWEVINFMYYCARLNDSKLDKLIEDNRKIELLEYFKSLIPEFKQKTREGDVPELITIPESN